MVTTRGADSNADLVKAKCDDYFEIFGQKNFTRTRRTITNNVSGRYKSESSSAITVVGDLQFPNLSDLQIISDGNAKLGDGMFFAPSSYDIVLDDEITAPSGKKYRLSKQIEGETIKDQEIYQGWFAQFMPDD
jgi:hypothetical protein